MSTEEEQRFCSGCGAPMSPSAKFCKRCGRPADTSGNTAPQMQTLPPQTQAMQPQAQVTPPQAQAAQPQMQMAGKAPKEKKGKENKPKKKKTGLIIALLAVVILLAAAGGSVLYLVNTPKYRYNAQVKKGDKYLEEEAYQEALESYLAAVEIQEADSELEENICKCYLQLAGECLDKKEYEEALEMYEEVLAYGRNKTAKSGRQDALIGIAQEQCVQGNYEEALDIFDELLQELSESDGRRAKINDSLIDVYAAMAEQYYTEGRQEESYNYYEMARALAPGRTDIYLGEADVILAWNRPLEAAELLLEGINNGADKEALLVKREDIINHTVVTEYLSEDYYERSTYDELGHILEYDIGNNSYSDNTTYTYDSDGNLTAKRSETSYSNGETSEYYTEYDALGNPTQQYFYNNGEVTSQYFFEYDASGNLLYAEENYTGGGQYVYRYQYDAAGNRTYYSCDHYDSSNDYGYHSEEIYEYDAAGNISRAVYVWEGERTESTYEYDAAGNRITEISIYYESDEYVSSTEAHYEYDSAGNAIHSVYYSSDGNNNECFYEYDSDGNLIQENCSYTNGYSFSDVYTYDENGNQLTHTYSNSDGYYDNETYEYDMLGNQIRWTYTSTYGNDDIEYAYDALGNMIRYDNYNYYYTYTYLKDMEIQDIEDE